MGRDEAAAVGVAVDAECGPESTNNSEAEKEDFAVNEEEDDSGDEPYC